MKNKRKLIEKFNFEYINMKESIFKYIDQFIILRKIKILSYKTSRAVNNGSFFHLFKHSISDF